MSDRSRITLGVVGSLALFMLLFVTLMNTTSLAPYLRAITLPKGLAEVVVNRPDYVVSYVAAVPPSGDIRVRVKLNGTPVDFSVYATAPALSGFVEVGRSRGRGEARMPINHYLGEAVRLVREL